MKLIGIEICYKKFHERTHAYTCITNTTFKLCAPPPFFLSFLEMR